MVGPCHEKEGPIRFEVGQKLLKRYVVEKLLSADENREVYRMEHAYLGVPVIVSVLQVGADAEQLARFERQARVRAKIRDRHVVSIINFDVIDGFPCIISEHVEGETLRAILAREGSLPWPTAATIVRDLLTGLRAVHAAGVVHRNLTLESVLVEPGEPPVARLGGFGFAKFLTGGLKITKKGEKVGRPAYMSPEQLYGQPLDLRSDLYSVGLILHELLCGRLPEAKGRIAELLKRSTRQPTPPTIPPGRPGLDAALTQLVMDALEPQPHRRPQTATEFLSRIEQCLARDGDKPRLAAAAGGTQERMAAAARPPLRMDSAWSAMAARARLRRVPAPEAPGVPATATTDGPAPQPSASGPVRVLVAARFLADALGCAEVGDALGELLPPSAAQYQIGGRFWLAILPAPDAPCAEGAARELVTSLTARFGDRVDGVASRLADPTFVLTEASLDGSAAPPREVMELLEQTEQLE